MTLTKQINWQDQESQIFLNPRFSSAETLALQGLYQQFHLPAHLWICSSGSTKLANESLKLIALKKSAILAAAKSVNDFLQVQSSDRWLNPLPIFHIGGIAIFARAELAKNIVEVFEKWNAQQFYNFILEKNITLTSLVPAQVYDLVQLNLKSPESLRAILVGGAALNPQLYQQARKLGWPLLPSFGMSESSAVVACANLQSLNETGFPKMDVLSHCQVQLSSENKLMLKSEALMSGYAQIRNGQPLWIPHEQNVWLVAEDFAELSFAEKKTFLKPLGRSQDFIKIKGEGVDLGQLRQKFNNFISNNFAQYRQQTYLTSKTSERDQNEICLIYEKIIPDEIIRNIILKFNETVIPYERIVQSQSIEKILRTDLGKVLL